MTVKFTYWRHFVEHTQEAATVQDAAEYLADGEYRGELSAAKSKVFDGDNVIEGRYLHELINAAYDEIESFWRTA